MYGTTALAASAAFPSFATGLDSDRTEEEQSELISKWDKETETVSPDVYGQYMRDGDARGFAALANLERAFEKVLREKIGRAHV